MGGTGLRPRVLEAGDPPRLLDVNGRANRWHEHVEEMISSLHLRLMHNRTMEVILVQGSATQLQVTTDRMITNRGVISGKLELTTTLIPQLHQPERQT